jgi:hypothetical protein
MVCCCAPYDYIDRVVGLRRGWVLCLDRNTAWGVGSRFGFLLWQVLCVGLAAVVVVLCASASEFIPNDVNGYPVANGYTSEIQDSKFTWLQKRQNCHCNLKANSHIPCRANAVPMPRPCRSPTMLCL